MGIDKCDKVWRKHPEWKVDDGLKKKEETQKEKEWREFKEDRSDREMRLKTKYWAFATLYDAYWSHIGEGLLVAEHFEIDEEIKEELRKKELEDSVKSLLLKFAHRRNLDLKRLDGNGIGVVTHQRRCLGEIFGAQGSRDLLDCVLVGGVPPVRGRKVVKKFVRRRPLNAVRARTNFRIPKPIVPPNRRRRKGLPYFEVFDFEWNDPTLARSGAAGPKTNWFYQNSLATVDPSVGASIIAGVTNLTGRYNSYCVTKMIMTIEITSASTTIVDYFYAWPSGSLTALNTLTPGQVAIVAGNMGGVHGMVQVSGVQALRRTVVATAERLVGPFYQTDLHYSAAFGSTPTSTWGINIGLAAEAAAIPSVNCCVSIRFLGFAFDPNPQFS